MWSSRYAAADSSWLCASSARSRSTPFAARAAGKRDAVAVGELTQLVLVPHRPPGSGRPEQRAAEPCSLLVGPVDQPYRDGWGAGFGDAPQHLGAGDDVQAAVEPTAVRDRVDVATDQDSAVRIAPQRPPVVPGRVALAFEREPVEQSGQPGAGGVPGLCPGDTLGAVLVARQRLQFAQLRDDTCRTERHRRRVYSAGVGSPGVDERLTWLRVPREEELPAEVLDLWAPSLERLGFVPNVLRLYALRPTHLLAWSGHHDELMKGDSGLSKAEREMIAVVVSVTNDCRYCIAAHSAALRKLTKDAALADLVASDHNAAAISERMKAALDWAVKLTREPAAATEADVQRLRAAGWSDEDVMDIAEVTGMFNMTNRMASGLGWEPNPEYETLGR